MGAKFNMCLLLVILVTSSVHCALLRHPQDAEKSPSFLYGRLFSDESPEARCCIQCGEPGCESFPIPCETCPPLTPCPYIYPPPECCCPAN